MTSARRHLSAVAALVLTAMLLPLSASTVAAESGATVPSGFRDELVWGSLPDHPMVVSFAPSGKVFVALKGGVINEYDSLTDATATQLVNLAPEVDNYWDRGLMGMVVDPQFPTRPYVYALYAYDHQLGDPPGAKWGDACPSPNPGGNTDGCMISGKLVRLTTNSAGTSVSSTKTLIEDWCQQYPSHSLGSLAFGPEGALYVTSGDGASFNGPDTGDEGGSFGSSSITPVNPCGDPTNEGGALRSQDIRTTGDPLGLDGTVLRIDPDTGAAWPDNANFGSGSANAQKVIAYGLRNPFRMTMRPNGKVWLGDVGFTTWEEIDTIPDANAAPRNFGWPCREGNVATPQYAGLDIPLCTSPPALAGPAYTYNHADTVTNDDCGTGSSSISGIAFRTTAGNYPSKYDNGLFFADYTRRCIWFAPASSGTANPDFTSIEQFANLRRSGDTSGGAVYVGVTPAGDIIYADYDRQEIRAIHYNAALPPNAAFTATPTSGPAPLDVDFDASASNDPNGDPMTFAWDWNNDGVYDDSGVTQSHTFTTLGNITVRLRVTAGGDTDTASRVINVGNTPPTPTISTPAASLTWSVGQSIAFSGSATDTQDGTLAASKFTWTLAVEHCPSNCHEHIIQTFKGVKSGTFGAPDHDYPSYIRLYLKVTDSGGLSTTVSRDLQPKTSTIDAISVPAGITLGINGNTGNPPPTGTGIVGSHLTVTAPSSVSFGGEDVYSFSKWSDGGARNHAAKINLAPTTLTATYKKTSGDASANCGGATAVSTSGAWRTGLLTTDTDVDWYKFSLTSSATMRIILGNLPEDASLSLYSGCSKLLVTSDRGGTNTEEIFKSLAKGSYSIKVTTKGTASTDPYSLNIRRMASGLSVVTSSSRVDGSTLNIVGEVYNGTSSAQGPSVITAKLYNAAGKLLATRTGRTDMSVPKGARVPFRMVGSVPAGWAKTVVTVAGAATSHTLANLTFSGVTMGYDTSRLRVTGTVRSSVAVSSYRVMMTTYNRVGTVVDVARAALGASTLAAGASTTFDAWSSYDGTVDRATLKSVGIKK
jgi:glucose/arabinose dehydrogenase